MKIMLKKIINVKKFTKEEIEILEYIYSEELRNNHSKKARFTAEAKVIQEAQNLIKIRPLKEEAETFEDEDKIKISNVLIEITNKKINGQNVEYSRKIKEAMFEDYIRDLMIYNNEFLTLLQNADMNKQYITIYSNYDKEEE